MSACPLEDSLPELDGATLDFVFDHVYDIAGIDGESQAPERDKLPDLLEILKAVQRFNYHHRPDESWNLLPLVGRALRMDPSSNSEGSLYWLVMLLAIKDLYKLDDVQLKETVRRINIRK